MDRLNDKMRIMLINAVLSDVRKSIAQVSDGPWRDVALRRHDFLADLLYNGFDEKMFQEVCSGDPERDNALRQFVLQNQLVNTTRSDTWADTPVPWDMIAATIGPDVTRRIRNGEDSCGEKGGGGSK